jgi:son of sevenless
MASEVIQDIKRWQSQPFSFHSIPSVQAFITESLNKFNDFDDNLDRFWNLSLEREPREKEPREDERMAKLLQESGFL